MALNPWRLQLLCQLEALGTVRAVAVAMHQSASSVSQQLAVLEAESGVRLIERTGRRVRLTAAGYLLASRGRDILDRMVEVEGELRALGQEASGVVRVAAFQSAIHSLAVPAAHTVRASFPAVQVVIEEVEPHDATSALLRGEHDIAITTTDFLDTPRHPDVRTVALATDAVVAVLPRHHRLSGAHAIDLAALAEENWVLDKPGTYMAGLATRLCRSAGFEPRVIGRFNNYLLTLQHVESAGSVALLPELTFDRRYAVSAVGLTPPVQRRITAALRASSAPRASVTAMIDALRAIARERPEPAPEPAR